jgi:hypothetical protein
MVIEVEPEVREDEEEYYAADFKENYGQWTPEEGQGEENERETQSPTSPEGEISRLCQQMVTLEVDDDLMMRQVLYGWGSTTTLVRNDTSWEIGLLPVPRRLARGFMGSKTVHESCFYLPLLNAD